VTKVVNRGQTSLFLLIIPFAICVREAGVAGRSRPAGHLHKQPQLLLVFATLVLIARIANNIGHRHQHGPRISPAARDVFRNSGLEMFSKSQFVRQVRREKWLAFSKNPNDRSALLSVAARNFKSLASTSSATSPLLIFHAPQMFFLKSLQWQRTSSSTWPNRRRLLRTQSLVSRLKQLADKKAGFLQ
jgi:hypothetical protein